MSDVDIQPGDKVRVTLDDEVAEVSREGRTVVLKNKDHGRLWFDLDEDNCTIEVLEKAKPPVVTFQPGDRLRRRGYGTFTYEITLADEGYLQHLTPSSGVKYYSYSGTGAEFFNSDNFDLVKLYEPPL